MTHCPRRKQEGMSWIESTSSRLRRDQNPPMASGRGHRVKLTLFRNRAYATYARGLQGLPQGLSDVDDTAGLVGLLLGAVEPYVPGYGYCSGSTA